MKAAKVILTVIILIVAATFFVNTWQGYRYERITRKIREMEEEQKDWLEKNKKLIAALAVFNSPERIEKLAEQLGLCIAESDRFLKVKVMKDGF